VCAYKDRKDTYKRQLLYDIDNMVREDGKWVKKPYDSRVVEERLNKTITWMYKVFDEKTAKELIRSTLRYYWYKNFFTLMNNHR